MNNVLVTILSLSVSGSILALILFVGKPFLKNRVSKTFSYYIWLLVLLRLILPVAAPVNAMGSLFGMRQPSVNSAATVQTGIAGENRAIQTHEKTTIPSAQAVTPETQNDKTSGVQWLQIWSVIKNSLIWLWLAGSVACFGWFVMAYAFFVRRIRHSFVAPQSEDLKIFERMCGNKRVHLACSSRVATPMFIGVFRMVIVLPQFAYVKNGRDKELVTILRHELTHYRRKDIIYKWIVVVVTSIHWFNPLMLLIRKEISRACELSCDEAVIIGMSSDEKRFYGNTLIALSANKKLPVGVLATTLCESKKELQERLESIMKFKKKSVLGVVMTLVLALMLSVCASALGAANIASAAFNNRGPDVSVRPNGTDTASFSVTSSTKIALNTGMSEQLEAFPVNADYGYWKIHVDSTSAGITQIIIQKDSPTGAQVGTPMVVLPGESRDFYYDESSPLPTGAYYLSITTDGRGNLGGNLYYKFAKTRADLGNSDNLGNKAGNPSVIPGPPISLDVPSSSLTKNMDFYTGYGYWKLHVDSTSASDIRIKILKNTSLDSQIGEDLIVPAGESRDFYYDNTSGIKSMLYYYLNITTDSCSHLSGNLYYESAQSRAALS